MSLIISGWPLRTVEELADESGGSITIGPFGSRMKADCYVEQGIPVIRGTNLTGGRAFVGDFVFITEAKAREFPNCIVRPGDLVFPHRGAIGEVGLVPDGARSRWMLSTSLMKFSCDRTKAAPLFLYYFFRSSIGRHALLVNASTVGTPGIGQPLSSLKKVLVPAPPLPEQRRIAAILGALDDKIDLNRQMNRTLEALAQAIFKSWFIDFDGHTDLVDSELGPIPRGWRFGSLPEVIEVNPTRSLRKGVAAPYLDMANMPTSGHRAAAWTNREFGSGMKFVNGDTLVARITPCLENGKTGLVDFLRDGQVGWGSTEYLVLRPRPPLPPAFGYYLARSEPFRSFAIQNMTGTSGRQRVPSECLRQFLFAVPPPALAARFGTVVEPLMDRIRAASEESKSLAALRDTLLPKLISGEIRVPEESIAVTEVT
jgi:type I restriction enzyme S subunit